MISTRRIEPHPPRRSKYGNIKTVVDGIKFSSAKESRRYSELMLLQRAGAISGLVLQPSWDLTVNGKKVCRYVADFRYEDAGGIVVEDTKSAATRRNRAYRIKKKLFEAVFHPLTVTET